MRAEVAHLLRRAGFGGRAEEIDAAERNGYEATVEDMLRGAEAADPGAEATPPPRFSDPTTTAHIPSGRQRANRLRLEQAAQLTTWWLDRMASVTSPLLEKRTWFWHGHWATSIQKVRSASLMLEQNQTLRRLGGGDFRDLTSAMVRDPALAVWLDQVGSTAKAPNENLARELMELFTLGVGHYSEEDVRQAARALTGWRLNRSGNRLNFAPSAFDNGTKTILGATDDFDADGLVALILQQPACSHWIATRLWNRYAAPGPVPEDTMTRLLTAYGPARDLTALLRALLLDPAFRGPSARGALAKQPVEWLVGTLRALDIRVETAAGPDRARLLTVLSRLGQVPFAPPNVGGWPSGDAWLTAAAAEARMEFARWAVTAGDISSVAGAAAVDRLEAASRLLGVDVWSARTAAALSQVRTQPRTLMLLALVSPEYAIN